MMAVVSLETPADGSIVEVPTGDIVREVEGSGAGNNDSIGVVMPVGNDEGTEDGGNVGNDDGEIVGSGTGTCVSVRDGCAVCARVRGSDIVGDVVGWSNTSPLATQK
jgi:hypothetical protein